MSKIMDYSSEYPKIVINVGGLEGVGSVYKKSSQGLREFNDLWLKHRKVDVVWDLRLVQNNRISIAALAFFLSIAHRVHHFTEKPQKVLLNWHSRTLGFLSDVGFFQVAKYYDLFEWPFELGGFEEGKINPNSKVLSFDELDVNRPDYFSQSALAKWKMIHREHYREDIIRRCASLFSSKDKISDSRDSILILSRTCAELAVNSLLWGKASAFMGLQRSNKRITISVSDIGIGMKESLRQKNSGNDYSRFDTDTVAVITSCILNENDFGLKRAIETVIKSKGTISIASGCAEIVWAKPMWDRFLSTMKAQSFNDACDTLPDVISKANLNERDNGYIREWKYSIKGTRITFSLPTGKQEVWV